MKRFYLFLGLLCTTTGASYAVQNNQYARVSTTKQTTGISETKKSILPTKKNTDTPVLSAVVRSGTGTLGSLSVNNDEQRLSLSNKTGLNKKIVQPGNSYKIPVPANIQQPESVAATTKVSELEKQIEELQAVVSTMDSKIAQAKQEAKDAAVQDAKKEIANEKEVIEQNIKTAKEEAVAVAANNAAAKFVETKDIDSKVDAVLVTKQFLTADSAKLNDFVKTQVFEAETTKIQKDINTAKEQAITDATAKIDPKINSALDKKQFLTADSLSNYATTEALTSLTSRVSNNENSITQQGTALTSLGTTVAGANSAIETLNNNMSNYATTASLSNYATTEALTSLTSRVSNNENSITQQGTALTNLGTTVAGANSAIETLNNNMSNYATTEALSSLTGRVSNNENSITQQGTALTNLGTTVAQNQAAALEAANQAKLDAIAAAEDYSSELWDEVYDIAEVLSSATDEGIKNNSKFNSVTTGHNFVVKP